MLCNMCVYVCVCVGGITAFNKNNNDDNNIDFILSSLILPLEYLGPPFLASLPRIWFPSHPTSPFLLGCCAVSPPLPLRATHPLIILQFTAFFIILRAPW